MAKLTRLHSTRVIIAACGANALEWYDFVIYGFLAQVTATLFFPTGTPTTSLLLTFGAFGVTFLVRPVGGIVLGNYADQRGRKAALTLTVLLMALGTAILTLAPTYASIGVGAPLIVLAGRLIQGFSAGGEFGAVTAFLVEHDPERPGYFASWQFATQSITLILASVVCAMLLEFMPKATLYDWGWRLPFALGLLIAPLAYYLRKGIQDPSEFERSKPNKHQLSKAFVASKWNVLLSLGAVAPCTVGMYTVLFLPTYATQQLGLAAAGAFTGGAVTGGLQAILIPIVGALSDRIGRTPICASAAMLILVSVYPMFVWLAADPSFERLLAVQLALGSLLAVYMGGLGAMMAELFPRSARSLGLSVSYALGVALFGGFAPFICTWFIKLTHDQASPSYYMMFAALVSLLTINAARARSRVESPSTCAQH
jgi:MHS family proline/betaine transporter-like MFS transporter